MSVDSGPLRPGRNSVTEQASLRSIVGAVTLGAGYGSVVSLSNELSLRLADLETRDWAAEAGSRAWAAEIASLILGAGWAWATLAVAAGWLAGARAAVAALSGALALLAATSGYYVTDSIVRQEPFGSYTREVLLWALASIVLGPALGLLGALIRHTGMPGLLARLSVPAGASLQMIVLPPASGHLIATPAMEWTPLIVWAAAGVVALALVTRYRRRLRTPAGA